jgi:hypothetical protein
MIMGGMWSKVVIEIYIFFQKIFLGHLFSNLRSKVSLCYVYANDALLKTVSLSQASVVAIFTAVPIWNVKFVSDFEILQQLSEGVQS